MPTFLGALTRRPARISFFWYVAVAVVGAFLLAQPFCRTPTADRITPLDAAFTATSALCVTGLAVRSTGQHFSWLGQAVILLLIQLGGVGIMTFTTFFTLRLGGRQSLHRRSLMADTLGAGDEPDLRWVLARVIRLTLILELAGAALLTLRFAAKESIGAALWRAVFHSVSAFCNAGFSLQDDSLVGYQDDVVVNLTIMLLIISGGIGYPVMIDVLRHWRSGPGEFWRRISLHSKLMLMGTAALLLIGMFSVLALEWNNSLRDLTLGRRLLRATFHSVSCRTAGFNSIEIGSLTNATLFVSMLLMTIGAGPCSTGGGFKVSTFLVLVLRGWSTIAGSPRVSIGRRTIPQEIIDRAVATALVFAVVAIFALTCVLAVEQSSDPHVQSQGVFLEAMFEVISALGTVGLTADFTGRLGGAGRVIIIVLMLIGRLGPITIFVALSRGEREPSIEYANEEPLIG